MPDLFPKDRGTTPKPDASFMLATRTRVVEPGVVIVSVYEPRAPGVPAGEETIHQVFRAEFPPDANPMGHPAVVKAQQQAQTWIDNR